MLHFVDFCFRKLQFFVLPLHNYVLLCFSHLIVLVFCGAHFEAGLDVA